MGSVVYDTPRAIAASGVDEQQIINLFLVGSRLHGTASPASDYDFVMVTTDEAHHPHGDKVESDHLDITIFKRSDYKAKVEAGVDWQVLEPLWAPEPNRWIFKENFLDYYTRDLVNLRVAVSSISNKGHSYAKILMTKESNYYVAKKNLAHGIRNLRLGIQVIEHGGIVDYTETKELYDQIMAETSEDWAYYNDKWTPIAMEHQKAFVALTPEKVKPPKEPKRRNRNKKNESTHTPPADASSSTQ